MSAGDSTAGETRRDGFLISDDPGRVDRATVHAMIARSYWARGIPREVMDRGIDGSMCFGVYEEATGRQVAIARVISDGATYAYLCDVFVDEGVRGRGLGKWLMEMILAHPRLQGLRRFCLLTGNAQGLYERYGFKEKGPGKPIYMEKRDPDVYKRAAQSQA